MWTAYTMVADSGLTWTPETFYVAVALAQMIAVLLGFRVLGLEAQYNTFIGALVVVIPANFTAYFLKDMEIVGVLGTSVILFAMLAMVARGDVIKAVVVWVMTMALYWAVAYFVIPEAEDLYIEDVAGLPQVMMEGGLTPQGFTEADVEALSGGKEDDD